MTKNNKGSKNKSDGMIDNGEDPSWAFLNDIFLKFQKIPKHEQEKMLSLGEKLNLEGVEYKHKN